MNAVGTRDIARHLEDRSRVRRIADTAGDGENVGVVSQRETGAGQVVGIVNSDRNANMAAVGGVVRNLDERGRVARCIGAAGEIRDAQDFRVVVLIGCGERPNKVCVATVAIVEALAGYVLEAVGADAAQ